MKSLAIVVPADAKDKADLVSVALGHAPPGETTYCVALSADGQLPATHYGCHAAATDEFIATIEAARSGYVPPINWAAVGLESADIGNVCRALSYRAADIDEYGTNFQTHLSALGLAIVSVPPQNENALPV